MKVNKFIEPDLELNPVNGVNGVMEADTISKNGRSLKSQTSKGKGGKK